jgi:ribosomal protein S18 acetylase RimI-like enzyme
MSLREALLFNSKCGIFSGMKTELAIRHATPDDLERLLDLYQHLNSDDDSRCPSTLAQKLFADFLQYRGSAILLGEIDSIIVTSCAIVVVPNLTRGGVPYALIENVVTHTNYRGMGYGKHVLDAATQLAWENGCYKVMLMTGSQNSGVFNFYVRAGFEQSKTGFQKRRMSLREV